MAKHVAEQYTPEEQLALWEQASAEVAATGVSRTIRGKTLTLSSAREIERMINYWTAKVTAQSNRSRTNLSRHKRPT